MSSWEEAPLIEGNSKQKSRTPQAFADQYGGVAQQISDKIGVAPHLVLGQLGLETGWGKSIIPGTNNLGNIKDFNGGGVAVTDNMNGSRDKYRAYKTTDEFANDYSELIKRKYPNAVGAGSDGAKFTAGLKGYAEDPSYSSKLLSAAGKMVNAIIPSANAAEPSKGNNVQKSAPVQASSKMAWESAPLIDASEKSLGTRFGAAIRNEFSSENLKKVPGQVAENLKTIFEPIATVATGLPATILGDMAGGVAKIAGRSSEDASEVRQKSQEFLTYQPRSEGAKKSLEAIDWAMTPITASARFVGDAVEDVTGDKFYGDVANDVAGFVIPAKGPKVIKAGVGLAADGTKAFGRGVARVAEPVTRRIGEFADKHPGLVDTAAGAIGVGVGSLIAGPITGAVGGVMGTAIAAGSRSVGRAYAKSKAADWASKRAEGAAPEVVVNAKTGKVAEPEQPIGRTEPSFDDPYAAVTPETVADIVAPTKKYKTYDEITTKDDAAIIRQSIEQDRAAMQERNSARGVRSTMYDTVESQRAMEAAQAPKVVPPTVADVVAPAAEQISPVLSRRQQIIAEEKAAAAEGQARVEASRNDPNSAINQILARQAAKKATPAAPQTVADIIAPKRVIDEVSSQPIIDAVPAMRNRMRDRQNMKDNQFENNLEATQMPKKWQAEFDAYKDSEGVAGRAPAIDPKSFDNFTKSQLSDYATQLKADIKAISDAAGQIMSTRDAHTITSNPKFNGVAGEIWQAQRAGWGKGPLLKGQKQALKEVNDYLKANK